MSAIAIEQPNTLAEILSTGPWHVNVVTSDRRIFEVFGRGQHDGKVHGAWLRKGCGHKGGEYLPLSDIVAVYANDGHGNYVPRWKAEGFTGPDRFFWMDACKYFVAAPAYLRTPPSGYEAGSLEDQLHRALHGFAGAADAYHELRKTGADDETLKDEIGRQMGDGGCYGATYQYDTNGGEDPRFYLGGRHECKGKPTLQGAALLKMARRVLGIPPAKIDKSGQFSLF